MNGNTNEHVPYDLASQQRINGNSVDMGAFERTPLNLPQITKCNSIVENISSKARQFKPL